MLEQPIMGTLPTAGIVVLNVVLIAELFLDRCYIDILSVEGSGVE
jgi:hypothetical protein